jgi:tetratricopeptide (TPR) repeat protein
VTLTFTFVLSCAEQSTEPDTLEQGIHFGNWVKTERLCNQILQKDPDNPTALISRARLRTFVGKNSDAIADCDHVLSANPQSPLALSVRSTALLEVGKTEAAEAEMYSYLALTKLAHDPATRIRRATAFYNLKDYVSEDKECQEILNQTNSATASEDLLNRGVAQIEQKQIQEALKTFTKLKLLHPSAPIVVTYLAFCHTAMGAADLALEECAESAKFVPDYAANEVTWASA